MDSKDILNLFLTTNHIPINKGSIFSSQHNETPEDFDSVRGMMLGLAIGDSLGAPTEGMYPDKRRAKFGDITDYQPNRDDGRRVGIPTDDTQMAFWTLEQMIHDDGFIADNIGHRFCQGELYGIGGSVREFIRNYKDRNQAWFIAGAESAGNGSVMRIAPMVIPHVNNPDKLWANTALSAMITHRDSASIAASLGFVKLLWELLPREQPPDPEWWVDEYVRTTRELETDNSHRPREGQIDYEGPIWRFMDRYVRDAHHDDRPVIDASNYWYSGAYLLETMPTVLYILMQYGDDPAEAIIRAVTDSKDNDTVGAIVGAAMGALHGSDALPSRWKNGLTGRTTADDDGRVFELLDMAEQQWNPTSG